MRVELERSGGLAGMTRRAVLNTADLDPALAQAAETALDALPWDQPPAPATTRDTFQFTVRLLDGAGHGRTAVIPESVLPPALRPLTDQLATRRAPRP
ncbi:protealysin inhibitor emfourin [Parafrankia elaeagni]|uniref:protealysin inhibitor emfourin n=1 Tax=Parafrankia elaeagni TaxID=222534 RepID=UPI0003804A9A|nr:protealysin inhibitor emfourin [Parafrankia elaeagni]